MIRFDKQDANADDDDDDEELVDKWRKSRDLFKMRDHLRSLRDLLKVPKTIRPLNKLVAYCQTSRVAPIDIQKMLAIVSFIPCGLLVSGSWNIIKTSYLSIEQGLRRLCAVGSVSGIS